LRDLTTGNETRLIFRFALPMLVGNIFQQAAQIINAAIVGKFIGADAMAAVGASFYIIFALIALVIGIGIGGTVVVSQYFGAKQFDSVKSASDTMLIFLTSAGAFAGGIGIIFARPILRLTNVPDSLLDDAQTFMSINMLGMFALFGYNAVAAILRGLGDSIRPLYFLVIATTLNLGLDLLFIIVFGWKIKGVAWATCIAFFVSFALSIIYLNKRHELLKFSLRTMKFSKRIFMMALRIGLPSGFQQTFVALGGVALVAIVNKMGVEIMTAYTVAGRIDSFISMPAMNFSAALSAFVGQNLAVGNYRRINRGLRTTLIMSGTICLTSMAVVVLWGEGIMRLFVNTDEPGYALIVQTGTEYLVIVCSFYIVFSSMFVMNGLLRGAGATLIPMFITLFSLWLIRLPLAWCLSEYAGMGARGIWWAIPIGWSTGFLGVFIYYLSGKWKGKGVVSD
jgi:putative MATE family efflux protein